MAEENIFDFMNEEPQDIFGNSEFEIPEMPHGARFIRKNAKLQMLRIDRSAKARESLVDGLPKKGETHHVISDAKYDFWMVILESVLLLGGVDEFYGSTWTMSRPNVSQLFESMDEGLIKNVTILTGTYFKSRETSVYATLVEGLSKRNGRYVAFVNHTKIALLHNGDDFIVFEGSANFTANPRLENYIIVNDEGLYDFHRSWMESLFKK